MRRNYFVSILLIALPIFMSSCAVTLTSLAPKPTRPHVVLSGNDTIHAGIVSLKKSFPSWTIVVDDTTLSASRFLYAHTNSGQRYYTIQNRIIEQIVVGKIDLFSNGRGPFRQNKPWSVGDSGIHTVKTLRLERVRKLPSPEFLKPNNATLIALVSDHEPARRQMLQAKHMRSYAIASGATGATLVGAGVFLILAGALNREQPNSESWRTVGFSGFAVGGMIFSIALPTFLLHQKRFRLMAIDTYNRSAF